jgi:hypothetical protein
MGDTSIAAPNEVDRNWRQDKPDHDFPPHHAILPSRPSHELFVPVQAEPDDA